MFKKVILVFMLAGILQGCVVAAAGAAVTAAGGAILYDRRPVKMMIKDDDLSYAISKKLFTDVDIRQQCHIVITSYNRVVLLVGQAPSLALKNKVLELAHTVPGVRRFYNEITVEAPSSSLTRASDAWLTTKVKTRLLAAKDLKSGQFKVLTENGTVFLMGVVSRAQAQRAVDIARHTGGVQKVVKVFEYKRDTEVINPPQKVVSPKSSSHAHTQTEQKVTATVPVNPQTDEALYQQDGSVDASENA